MKSALFILVFLLSPALFAQTFFGQPEEIPEAGRIHVDGKLDDWRRADWTPLEEIIDGVPKITGAEWSLFWTDEPAVYIAVRYTDADIILKSSYAGSNAQDSVEIFVRANPSSSPSQYATTQESAQNYIFGLSPDRKAVWRKLASADRFPQHNPAKAAIALEGNTFIYEIMVPLYDRFSITNRRRVSRAEAYADIEIGIDIFIIDAGTNQYHGTISGNLLPDKRRNADHIAVHTLIE